MEYEGISLRKEAGVAVLTLERPEQLNAITLPMVYSLAGACDEIEDDKDVKAVVLTGAGRGFCAGLDVSAFEHIKKMSQAELGELMKLMSGSLYNISKPVIAAINGATAGAGMSLSLLCDIRLASEKAWFSSGYMRMGIIPDLGFTYCLPRIIGTSRALDMMISNERINAAEAERLGIVSRVVPQDDLMKAAMELADTAAEGPSIAIGLAKQAVRRGIHNSLEQQVEFECFADYICFRTDDHEEGARAFQEKRPPQFLGK
jgi:2-(1,2-epoxy-1,2-dihydrophenyl)acetyl-CoA isomerase